MIDAHQIVRVVAVVAAAAIPLWLLADRPAPPVPAGPVIVLTAMPPTPLPARTLFAPSAITAEDAVPASGGVPRLMGIAGRLPDDAVALLRFSDGATRSLRRGEQAQGWTVAAIAADRVRLSHGGREHVEILPAIEGSADQ